MAPMNLHPDNQNVKMLEIEEALSGPNAREKMTAYDERLISISRRAKQAMDEGLSQEDFQKCQLLLEAVTTARKILRLTLNQNN